MDNNKPTIKNYEGHKTASEGLRAFEREHAGHKTTYTIESDTLAILRCVDCPAEFREIYGLSGPVTSN